MSYKVQLDKMERRGKLKHYIWVLLIVITIFFLWYFNYYYQKNTKVQSVSEAKAGKVVKNIYFDRRGSAFFQCKIILDNDEREIDAFCSRSCVIGDTAKVIKAIRPWGGVVYEVLSCNR